MSGMPENIRVIVVDDSAFARLAISKELQSAPGIVVIDSARDGAEALEKVKQLKPDVVTMDVNMPNMDGITTLSRIMAECPTPVVMLSSLTGNGTETTIKALEAGAVDFFLKHSLSNPVGVSGDAIDLKTKIIMASKIKLFKSKQEKQENVSISVQQKLQKLQRKLITAERVVVIGSSTGGPKALYQLIPKIPADIPAAVLVVQHMPPGFTYTLAQRLDQLSNIIVKEVVAGDILYKGVAYIAKGGQHMVVDKTGRLALNQDPPVCSVRPSIDVTMKSAVKYFGCSVDGVVLTGMGCDGTNGSQAIKDNGGNIIAEHETTCVVYGMPKSVADAGLADKIIPLPGISDGIMEILRSKVKESI
jgi:two-component system, chemotaxis family, protein-glutamate methylesterase/glutaminase